LPTLSKIEQTGARSAAMAAKQTTRAIASQRFFRKMLLLSFMLILSSSISSAFVVTHSNTRLNMSIKGESNEDTEDKLVIVTGGARGIGKATCLLLASRGYQVAVNYRSNEKAALQVVSEITSSHGDNVAKAFQADVSQEQEVEQLFSDVIKHFGRNPTSLVCNAGVMEPMEKDITKITKETLDKDFATNTYGPFFCVREFVKLTSTKNGGKGGSIVNVSSVSADGGQIVAYAMSKCAMEAMVNGIAKTLPLEGIRINTVVPGLIDTGMATPEQIEILSGVIPMRRAGEPNEIAKAIAFLLSDESSYCTGTRLKASGGL
jgi:NAD(P)-dependent dehydrogenase (short-subunit alcohol dehydrogenase family)